MEAAGGHQVQVSGAGGAGRGRGQERSGRGGCLAYGPLAALQHAVPRRAALPWTLPGSRQAVGQAWFAWRAAPRRAQHLWNIISSSSSRHQPAAASSAALSGLAALCRQPAPHRHLLYCLHCAPERRSVDCVLLPDGTPDNFPDLLAQVQNVHALVSSPRPACLPALSVHRRGGRASSPPFATTQPFPTPGPSQHPALPSSPPSHLLS